MLKSHIFLLVVHEKRFLEKGIQDTKSCPVSSQIRGCSMDGNVGVTLIKKFKSLMILFYVPVNGFNS